MSQVMVHTRMLIGSLIILAILLSLAPCCLAADGLGLQTGSSVQVNSIRYKLTVNQAVKIEAERIKYGGKELAYLLGLVDPATAAKIKAASDAMYQALMQLSGMPGLTLDILKDKVFHFLADVVGISPVKALIIADAIKIKVRLIMIFGF
ncbi:MAG: hypothetical protein ACM3UZ_14460 [Acidobacteriota bacterium]